MGEKNRILKSIKIYLLLIMTTHIPAIGIDLGTTFSCVGVWQNNKVEIIANQQGNRITPSYVTYSGNNLTCVGDASKNMAISNPTNTIFDAKRLIGRKFDDPEVQSDMKHWPFKVIKDAANKPLIHVEYKGEVKDFSPEEISSMVLRNMKETASKYLGETVKQAVITVPAYFNDSQRQATKDAGKIAGLEVLRIINEPTAASLSYGLDKKDNETILVFDLGGGTFDVSILEVGDGVFEVLATSGDTRLGGDDFDEKIVQWLASEFEKEEGFDLTQDNQALQRLTEAAEKAKIELSNLSQAAINLPFISVTPEGPKHLEKELTRTKFEELCSNLIDRCETPIKNALK